MLEGANIGLLLLIWIGLSQNVCILHGILLESLEILWIQNQKYYPAVLVPLHLKTII